MNKFIFTSLLIAGVLTVTARAEKTSLSQSSEAYRSLNQDNTLTATIKTSTRLFKAKEDLTSVIIIIPAGTVVSVLDSDSTYFHVAYEEGEGFIFRKHAVLDKAPASFKDTQRSQKPDIQPVQPQSDSRYTELENKYGASIAARLYDGKIWKGLNSDMARDSWGAAQRINRVVSGNKIKEEWIYRSTWLYFENNTLLQWGPVKQ